METSLAVIVVLALVAIGVGAYFFLMIFYPEWVGITGPTAKKAIDEHQSAEPSKDSSQNTPIGFEGPRPTADRPDSKD